MPKLRFFYVSLLVLTLLYLCFPTHNATIDAWFYAASVKHGQHLFLPHHLLYNVSFYIPYQLIHRCGFSVSALSFMTAGNALLGVATLWGLGKILAKMGIPDAEVGGWVAFAGVCFGFWRFTTENENYIFPIPFSLLGSYFFWRFTETRRRVEIVKASLWAAVACLFHQIHFAWWLGLGLGVAGSTFLQKDSLLKNALAYILPAWIVPLTYMAVLFLYCDLSPTPSHLLEYVLHDFQNGDAKSEGSWRVLAVMLINTTRSFMQIHGSIAFMVRESVLFALPICMLFVGEYLLLVKWKTRQYLLHMIRAIPLTMPVFIRTHLVVICLHLGIALLSRGNAEFLAMLPILVVLVAAPLSTSFQHTGTARLSPFAILTLSLGLWNFSYGIFPFYYYPIQNMDVLREHIVQNPRAGYLLRIKPLIENQLFFETGQEHYPLLMHLPSVWEEKGNDIALIQHKTDSLLRLHQKVYTDVGKKIPLYNRQAMLQKESINADFFRQYELIPVIQEEIWEVKLR